MRDQSEGEMAETFEKAMVHALGCIGKAGLTLKQEQGKAVRHIILNGQDTFVWLPTGFGKSICYECLPFAFDSTLEHIQSADVKSLVIVISPLRSLMVDHVASLKKSSNKRGDSLPLTNILGFSVTTGKCPS